LLGILGNLQRQLSRRRQHQRARFTAVAFAIERMVEQPGKDGDQKGRRLAGAGLGLTGHIQPVQGMDQRLRLNRRAVFEPRLIDGTQQLGWNQLELAEPGFFGTIGRGWGLGG